jgi:signal transduction histidine kinase
LRGLVARFLDFERARRGEIAIQVETFDVVAMTAGIAVELLERLPRYNLLLNGCSPAEDGLPVVPFSSDPTSVERILQNLLDNAFKYGNQEIEVEIDATNSGVAISIWNNGPSIPEDEREKVFNEFYRRQAESGEGFGIGLASVRLLVRAIHGTIRIEAPPRGGTSFILELPTLHHGDTR